MRFRADKKGILILAALFAASLTGISFYGGPVTWLFFLTVLFTPFTCIIYIIFVIFMIKIYQKADGRGMTASAPSDFYITINNESFFSFSSVRMIFYSSFSNIMGLDDKTVYELPPNSSVTRNTKLVCKYRGEYLVGIKELEVRDFLDLFSVTYRIREPLSVIVAPAMIELSELRNGEDIEDSDIDSRINPAEPDITVREYVPGDNIRLIHHKASAVMQKPMIRELKGGEKDGVLIVMEASRHGILPEEYLPSENRVIESVLALSLYYIRKNIPADIVYRQDALINMPVRTYPDHERLYGIMRTYSFGAETDTLSLLEELSAGGFAYTYRMIIFVLNECGPEEYGLIEKINISRVPVRIYVCSNENDNDLSGEVTGDGNINIIPIGTELPTEDVL